MKFGRSWIDEALHTPEAWVRRLREGDGEHGEERELWEREAWTRWRGQERPVVVARTVAGPVELGRGVVWIYPLHTGLQRMRELHLRVVAPERAVSLAAVQDQGGAGARALHQRAVASALATLRVASDAELAELCRGVFGYARSVGSSDGIESVLLSCIVAAGRLGTPLARSGLETWRLVGPPRQLGAGLAQTPVLDASASLVSFIGPDELAAFGRGVDAVTGGPAAPGTGGGLTGVPGRGPGGGDPAADNDKDGTCMAVLTIAGGILGAVGGGILGYSAPGSSAGSGAQGVGATGGAATGMLGGASGGQALGQVLCGNATQAGTGGTGGSTGGAGGSGGSGGSAGAGGPSGGSEGGGGGEQGGEQPGYNDGFAAGWAAVTGSSTSQGSTVSAGWSQGFADGYAAAAAMATLPTSGGSGSGSGDGGSGQGTGGGSGEGTGGSGEGTGGSGEGTGGSGEGTGGGSGEGTGGSGEGTGGSGEGTGGSGTGSGSTPAPDDDTGSSDREGGSALITPTSAGGPGVTALISQLAGGDSYLISGLGQRRTGGHPGTGPDDRTPSDEGGGGNDGEGSRTIPLGAHISATVPPERDPELNPHALNGLVAAVQAFIGAVQ